MKTLKPPFEIYFTDIHIGDADGHICTAENAEIAKAILFALRAVYEKQWAPIPGNDK